MSYQKATNNSDVFTNRYMPGLHPTGCRPQELIAITKIDCTVHTLQKRMWLLQKCIHNT